MEKVYGIMYRLYFYNGLYVIILIRISVNVMQDDYMSNLLY